MNQRIALAIVPLIVAALSAPARAVLSAEEPAKIAQNPVAAMVVVPLGMGVGTTFHFGKLPVNMQLGGYYNVVHPDDGPNAQLRFQVQFMFPK